MQINLSTEQFIILEDLIARGMEDKLAPFDDIELGPDEEVMIERTLDAVALFNSHKVTNNIEV